jgi:transposase InsO family protein
MSELAQQFDIHPNQIRQWRVARQCLRRTAVADDQYEEVYLRAYDSVSKARESLRRYLTFYNIRRPHSALGGRTPDQAYLKKLMSALAVA